MALSIYRFGCWMKDDEKTRNGWNVSADKGDT
jgi:hypothetical protein